MTENNPNTYEPSAHLIATSGFTASQLSDQYLAFKGSIQVLSASPGIVFEGVLFNALASTVHNRPHQQFLQGVQAEDKPPEQNPTATGQQSAQSYVAAPPVQFSFTRTDKHLRGLRADSGWGGLYGAGGAWPDAGLGNAPTLQHGIYKTTEDGDWDRPLPDCFHDRIDFRTPFSEFPTVVVWLTGVDIRGGEFQRVEVTDLEVDQTGFMLQCRTFPGSALHDVSMAWIAFGPDEGIDTESMLLEVFESSYSGGLVENSRSGNWKQALLVVDHVVLVGQVTMPIVVDASSSFPFDSEYSDEAVRVSVGGEESRRGFCLLGITAILGYFK